MNWARSQLTLIALEEIAASGHSKLARLNAE